MTNPDTAALDPIFWLDHANIDRLWNVWLRQKRHPGDPPDAFKNPTDADWLDGPRDQEFSMPRLDGTLYKFTARDVLDTKAPTLDYVYDDEAAPAAPADHLAMRLERLGASPERAMEFAGALTMAPPKPAELLGANQEAVRLNDDVVETHVRLDTGQRRKLSDGLKAMALGAAPAGAPDRVFLNLENIRSQSDAAMFYVYVNLPRGADPEEYPDHLAGTISMFGVSKATAPQGTTGGSGVNASLDITSIMDKLHLNNALGEDFREARVGSAWRDQRKHLHRPHQRLSPGSLRCRRRSRGTL